jgi:hypothetical protein
MPSEFNNEKHMAIDSHSSNYHRSAHTNAPSIKDSNFIPAILSQKVGTSKQTNRPYNDSIFTTYKTAQRVFKEVQCKKAAF